jgi:hypothetical protein
MIEQILEWSKELLQAAPADSTDFAELDEETAAEQRANFERAILMIV